YADNTAACGVCESCRLRLKAFAEAGYKDPITYRGQ
ncbi:MAG TPA: 7-cyano-7-deazaguanine synthase, partial [Candidatus Syntrophosphaera sp.]|nr:7-cyano-7-deazaguanine synthase [Candidatus Syntrophosphaera sp.]